MLQRIQTVHFALAIILIALPLLGMDFALITRDNTTISLEAFSAHGMLNGKETSDPNDFWGLQAVLMLLLGYVIMSYKNRGRQIFLAWIAFALNILSAAWIVLGAYVKSISCTMCKESSFSLSIGFYIFTIASLFIFLGIRGVRKDKLLVDSLNRLR